MDESKSVEGVSTENEEYEALMPEGWKDGDDFFNPDSWGTSGTADAQSAGDSPAAEEKEPSFEEMFRTLGQQPEAKDTDQAEDTEPAPGTTPEGAESGKLRFRATFDHHDTDVELDPNDLPVVWQKAQALDRTQTRARAAEDELAAWDGIAKQLGYADRKAMRSGVIENAVQDYMNDNPGVPEDMARDWVFRKFGSAPAAENSQPQEVEPAAANTASAGRDFTGEINALFTAFPDAANERIPDDVVVAAIRENKPLVQVYGRYRDEKAKNAARAAQEENKILKQNQASAARAPVSPVTRGGKTDTRPADPFLAGFYADD